MDLIKKAYDLKFPGSNELTTLLAKPLRVSSQRDYQNKFAYFIKYLRDRNINFYKLTLQNVLDFFVYLFYVRNLLPSTIKIYRSALAKPLKVGLNLDIGTPEATELIKAMLLQRPIPPPSAPAWNLHKVLIAINNMEWNLHVTQALQRAAFLLLLATGYRISELHACVRSSSFCSISNNGVLRIRPHPTFLAKNECVEKRWTHKVIEPLYEGQVISKLCPVTCLKQYLKVSKLTDGPLFVHPVKNKVLSKFLLSKLICDFIKGFDPSVSVKVHDIRKFAASYAILESMDVKDVTQSMGWTGPASFFKHYLFQEDEPLNIRLPTHTMGRITETSLVARDIDENSTVESN